ncbi:mechanosensitive ion channel family protein [Ekhidna sp.]
MHKLFFTILTLLTIQFSIGQDSLDVDSVALTLNSMNQQLETYERLLSESSKQREEDSLAMNDLINQIQLLQAIQAGNAPSLQEQINAVEEKDSIRNRLQKLEILELSAGNRGHVVNPLQDSLFTIYTGLGPIQSRQRALNVTEKIEILIRDDLFFPDSLHLEEHDGTLDVMYRNLILTSVSDWDALWMQGETKRSLARAYKEKISEFIQESRNKSNIENVAARIGLVFLILGGVVLVLHFLRRLVNGIQGWMVVNKSKYFTGFKIRNFEILTPSLHLDIAVRIMSILKWAIYALVFYLSLPLIFGLFPFTRGWAQNLIDWILSPAQNAWYGFWNYLPNLFTIAVIYLITVYLVKFMRFIASEVESGTLKLPGFYSDWAIPTYRLGKVLVYSFMLVVVYPYLPGSESDIFKGVSIFLALMVAFGSTSAVANGVAGLVITYMRPFRIGDHVKIGEVAGVVVEKTLLVTRVRTIKNEDITVPNSSILTGHTINYTSSSKALGLILNTSVTIGYEVPWTKVHELLIEAAVATDGVNVSKEPFVLQTSLNERHVSYQLNAYTDSPEMMPNTYSELHANIQDKFKNEGIDLVSPL